VVDPVLDGVVEVVELAPLGLSALRLQAARDRAAAMARAKAEVRVIWWVFIRYS
jgi:hypothetical protein